MTDTDTLARRAEQLRARVAGAAKRSGRLEESVTIVGASKTVPVESIRAAFDLGFTTFGENRVQEARLKIASLPLPGIQWELIGHLQTNKAARATELFARIESVDSLRLAQALNGAAAQQGRILPILLEVNVSGEATKSGLRPDELMDAFVALTELTSLRPEGLMTVAPLAQDPEQVRPIFQQLRSLRDQLRAQPGFDGRWHELSMGMSDDFEVAIEEGATIVRIGRALFGARPTTPSTSPT
ncbi:MAG: YggS family pyridoxal phosphate-dependent enzyme [Ktedonobacterales bacterium]